MNDIKPENNNICLDTILEFVELEKHLKLGLNPVAMYLAFYEQHKEKHGSYKNYIGNNYFKKMEKRNDWIYCQINEVYESRLNYERAAKIINTSL